MHQLHLFTFLLFIIHVMFCVLIMLLGSAKIHAWSPWKGTHNGNSFQMTDPTRDYLVQNQERRHA